MNPRESWRLVPFATGNGALNMAIDKAVVESVSFNESSPTMRFYGWDPPCVTIGCFQSAADEVDLDVCKRLGVDVVRRRTGGGAVFHDAMGEITYSVICPERMVGPDILASYRLVCGWIVDALRTFGIEAEHRPINDVHVNGKKVSGNAQTRRSGVFAMHGTVLYKVDRARMFGVLRVGKEKVSDKEVKDVGQGVIGVSELTNVGLDDLQEAMVLSFLKEKQWFPGELSNDELARADSLVASRYAKEQWNLSR